MGGRLEADGVAHGVIMLKTLISFGFRQGEPEELPGVVVVDVRRMFKNPYHNRSLRHLTGLDLAIQKEIASTPDFYAKVAHLKKMITVPGTEIAYVGCVGGRHRSVFLAELLGKELGVTVEHRDLEKR